MQKGTVLSLKGLNVARFFKENNILVVLFFFMLSGIAVGIFTGGKIPILFNYSSAYLQNFITDRTGASFISVATDSFASSMLCLLIVFAAGTSALGGALIPIAITLRCVLFGSVTAYLYAEYSVKGIAFNAVLIIPAVIIFIIALLLAARESVKFSLLILKISLPATPPINLSYDFKNYCGRYIFISVIVLASALTDAVLSCSFLVNLTL